MKGEEILDRVRHWVGEHGEPYMRDINRAYRDILKSSGYWPSRMSDTDSLTFREDVSLYTLPLHRIRRLEQIAVRENEDEQEWHTLWPLTQPEFDEQVERQRKSDGTDETDRPEFYVLYGGETDNLQVVPTPDGTYNGRLIYIGEPEPLDRNSEPILPESYHEDIALKAASDILLLSENEAAIAKGGRIRGMLQQPMRSMAFDLGHNRATTFMPRQRLMRVSTRRHRVIRT